MTVLLPVLKQAMADYHELTGREYKMVETYRMEDAEYAIVGMGTIIDTAEATIDWIRDNLGIKVGAVHVTCFRPFPSHDIVEALKHVKAFSVVERMDNPLSQSNPLTREIKAAFADALVSMNGYSEITYIPRIYSGSAGLGSRDVRPGDIISITRNMMKEDGLVYFVTGITHDLALTMEEDPDIRPSGGFSMRGHSVGGFGSVTTNKVIATNRRRCLRQKGAGLSKVWLREKGLADHLLPDRGR